MAFLRLEKPPENADNHTKGYAMDLDSIVRFISTPLIPKLIVQALAFSVLLFVRKRDLENVSTVYLGSLGLFLVRDILLQFFPFPEIVFVSDLLALVSISFVYSWFLRKRVNAFVLLGVNAALLIAFAANLLLSFLPVFSPRLYSIGLGINLLWFLLLCVLATKKGGETLPELVVAKTWILMASAFFVLFGLTAAFGFQNELIQRLLYPIFYCLFIPLSLTQLALMEKQGHREREYLTNTIDSIYAFMERSGTAFKNSADMNELLTQIVRSISEETKASGALIAMVDEFDDILAVKVLEGNFPPPFKIPSELPRKQARIEAFMKHAQFKLGETALGEPAKSGQSIFINDPAHDPRVAVNGEEDFFFYNSLIVVPLSMGDKVIGVIALSRGVNTQPFSEFEYERCRMLADFGTIVIRNLMSAMEASEKSNIEKEAAIAADIQKTLTPKKLVDTGKMTFGAFLNPARGVYSDYYDIIYSRSNKAILVMADVAGKGIQASLIMVMIRALIHLTTNTSKDISTILTWVNRGITGKIEMDHFATLAIISVDTETGDVEYANANQQSVMVIRKKKNETEFIEAESVPIGVERKTEYTSSSFKLNPGDSLVLYTDGIPEAMNIQGKQYGKKRLSDIIMRNMNQSSKDLAVTVRKDVQDFVGQARQHDDQSLLIMKMKT